MKIANTTLLNSILSSVWMVSAEFANNMSPLVAGLMQGKEVNFPTQENNHSFMSVSGVSSAMNSQGIDELSEPQIAIVSIKGGITKYDQFCGPMGTQSLNKLVKSLDRNSNVSAIVFDMDTPGGQATFLNTLGNTIANCSKPTVATYSGVCASAGYYLASACDEMYAQEKTDVVGSIGTMITITDFTEKLAKEGIKLHSIYSKHSTEKNSTFAKALEGDYEPIQEMLDEFSEDFIDFVKANREGVDEKVFKGATYTSRRAKKLGLIDGVKTFEQVIDRANELADNNNDNNSGGMAENNTHNMKIKNIANALGMETIEAHEGQVSLSVENMEILNGLLEPKATEETALVVENVASNEEVSALTATVASLEKRLATVEATTTTHTSQIETIGSATHTDFSVVNRKQDEVVAVESWNDPKNPNNIVLDEKMGTK